MQSVETKSKTNLTIQHSGTLLLFEIFTIVSILAWILLDGLLLSESLLVDNDKWNRIGEIKWSDRKHGRDVKIYLYVE